MTNLQPGWTGQDMTPQDSARCGGQPDVELYERKDEMKTTTVTNYSFTKEEVIDALSNLDSRLFGVSPADADLRIIYEPEGGLVVSAPETVTP